MGSRKGLYVIDTLSKEVIDYLDEGGKTRDFICIDGKVKAYDESGVLYEIEGVGEGIESKLSKIDREIQTEETFTESDFTISDNMEQKYAELRERFQIAPPYQIEEAVRKEFLEDIKLLRATGARYQNDFLTLQEKFYSQSASVQYGSLGNDLYRGFYSPFVVKEKISSMVRRGRLLKRLTNKTERYYKYHFNQDGKLIIVERYLNETCLEVEFILRENEVAFGLRFDTRPMNGIERLSHLSLERFDEVGRIVRAIEYVVFLGLEQEQETYYLDWAEQREYEANSLALVTVVKGDVKVPKCEGERYKISLDFKGKYKVKYIEE